MKRRDTLAGLASLGVLGGGMLVASGRLTDFVRGETIRGKTLETLDTRGSDGGEATIPERGTVTFIDFFATWCTDCRQYMGTLTEFHERAPDHVEFVSVTTEQVGSAITRDEISHWWNRHRGNWTVALDPSLTLAEPIGATYVPHSFVLDETNRIIWSESGLHDVEELEAALSDGGITET